MNQQLFDDSTLIRIFALHELHNLKDRGLTRGALLDYHSRYKLVFLDIFAHILIPQNASSWRRLSTVIAVASNRFLRR